ncbi:hypothetical protein KEM60_01487 [Austwickia sp. TVS 96-490-7B]|uniref:LysE family translocator n=1 Tax=Austwickia sp. TVS 96-490-7B TaxID=2830843 RepID=UPI001C58CFF8|nr:hypothetical protein [Austwickia sp. TVS 96-490-7B]MBW3085290.1 hypothetical protein [Austwickia sp. TVS 96-490-7B]
MTANDCRVFEHTRDAFFANLLNVKAASVYLTLAPQFLPAHEVGVSSMLSVAGVHVTVMSVWLGVWSTGLTLMTARLNIPRWRNVINRCGGMVLIAMGVRSATDIN